MGRAEIENIIKLFKIRVRESKGFHLISTLTFIYFSLCMTSVFHMVFNNNIDAAVVTPIVYPTIALAFTVISSIYYSFQYDEYNIRHQIFPQTGMTRMISYELYQYYTLLLTQFMALGLYLLQYLICYILKELKGGISFVYTFSFPFILLGFILNLLYGMLLIALIHLVSVIVRKFRWKALIVCLAFILFLWLTRDFISTKAIFLFYINETSAIIFLIKGVVTWVFLEFMIYYINLHTVSQVGTKLSKYNIIIASVILSIMLITLVTSYLTYKNNSNVGYFQQSNDYPIEAREPVSIIDVSKLDLGTSIKINYDDDVNLQNNILLGDNFKNDTKSKIIIYYCPKKVYSNWVDYYQYTNQRLKVSLKNNILHLEVEKDNNIKVIAMYPYSTLTQFKCFWNKNFAKMQTGNMSGNFQGIIEITTPEGITITDQ